MNSYFANQLFQTGVDVFMPATTPPDGRIAVRQYATRIQTINVPNWASSEHRINVEFNDYVQ